MLQTHGMDPNTGLDSAVVPAETYGSFLNPAPTEKTGGPGRSSMRDVWHAKVFGKKRFTKFTFHCCGCLGFGHLLWSQLFGFCVRPNSAWASWGWRRQRSRLVRLVRLCGLQIYLSSNKGIMSLNDGAGPLFLFDNIIWKGQGLLHLPTALCVWSWATWRGGGSGIGGRTWRQWAWAFWAQRLLTLNGNWGVLLLFPVSFLFVGFAARFALRFGSLFDFNPNGSLSCFFRTWTFVDGSSLKVLTEAPRHIFKTSFSRTNAYLNTSTVTHLLCSSTTILSKSWWLVQNNRGSTSWTSFVTGSAVASIRMCNRGLFMQTPRNPKKSSASVFNSRRWPNFKWWSISALPKTSGSFEDNIRRLDFSHTPPNLVWHSLSHVMQLGSSWTSSSLSVPCSVMGPLSASMGLRVVEWKRSLRKAWQSARGVSMSMNCCFKAPVP